MKKEIPILNLRSPVEGRKGGARRSSIADAFTLIEVMVVMTLLSLIVFALMAVFNTTQSAFRTSVTQSDILEGGRSTMDLMAGDLRQMAPSLGQTNLLVNGFQGAVNFYANTNANATAANSQPLVQSLTASPGNQQRVNVLENFFILSRGNLNGVPTWFGTGYAVTNLVNGTLYSLYRFSTNHPASTDPAPIFYNDFQNFLKNIAAGSRLMDGVVDLRVRAYDNNGYWMTNTLSGQNTTNNNVQFLLPSALGEVGFKMFGNTLPASVEIQMGVLEDRVLQRAESIPVPGTQSNYLAQQIGKVHVFRQRVSIPNVDPAAYQ